MRFHRILWHVAGLDFLKDFIGLGGVGLASGVMNLSFRVHG